MIKKRSWNKKVSQLEKRINTRLRKKIPRQIMLGGITIAMMRLISSGEERRKGRRLVQWRIRA
jgi:hypothetical protein